MNIVPRFMWLAPIAEGAISVYLVSPGLNTSRAVDGLFVINIQSHQNLSCPTEDISQTHAYDGYHQWEIINIIILVVCIPCEGLEMLSRQLGRGQYTSLIAPSHVRTSGLCELALRQLRYKDKTSLCNPEYLIACAKIMQQVSRDVEKA